MDRPDVINTCGNGLSLTGVTTCGHAGEQAASVVSNEEVAAVSGAAFAISAGLFRRLGRFDERIWPYLEDTDLSWRARLAGYRCLLAARSVVAHDYKLKLPPDKIQALERNRYLMLAQNLSGKALLALLPHLLVAEILTWGWTALQGLPYLHAKSLADLWILTHPLHIVRAHRTTQRLRCVPDADLLRRFPALPPITAVSSGRIGRFATALLQPVSNVTSAFALSVMGTSPPGRHALTQPWLDDSERGEGPTRQRAGFPGGT
jgi:hypothetical protein